LRAAVERCRSCKGRCAASCNYTSLHGMRDLREFVASLSRAAHPMWSFALEDKKEHVVRKRVPTRRAVFGRFKAPAIIDHQPPRWQARGRDKDAGRARVSRNVRADRTAWLSGCSSSLRCCHISSDTHLQPPYHKHLQHLEIASLEIHDLDIISYHRQAIGGR
jgi:hypothetical protein